GDAGEQRPQPRQVFGKLFGPVDQRSDDCFHAALLLADAAAATTRPALRVSWCRDAASTLQQPSLRNRGSGKAGLRDAGLGNTRPQRRFPGILDGIEALPAAAEHDQGAAAHRHLTAKGAVVAEIGARLWRGVD